jgi:3',5'-cyclic AMP phosphodiesterase CpdA
MMSRQRASSDVPRLLARRDNTSRGRLLAAAAALCLLAGCGGKMDAPAMPAASTLQATLVDRDGDGALERGLGEPLRDRTDIGGAGRPGAVLTTVAQLTDTHVRDEESPARVPFLARLGGVFRSTFRPQEALSPQVLAAAVRSVNRLDPDAVMVTGDIVDSAEQVELDQAIAVLAGGRVDPNTGGPGYAGVQAASDPDPLFYRPDLDAPRHPGLLAAAERPFRSPGLDAPWYPALGNHDLLAQGETPPTARIDAVATGGRLVVGLDPDAPAVRAAIRRGRDVDSAQAVDALLAAGAPGRSLRVPSDPRRRHLNPAGYLARLATVPGAPAPVRAAAGHATLDYAVDLGPHARALVLDTVDRRGGSRGLLRPAQLAWLRAELRRAAGRALLVFTHNPLDSTTGGDAALAALDATPGVVAAVAGNSHRNRIRPRATADGGYWQISTSSLADYPQQARALRLRRSDRGYVLETWMIDHDGRGVAGAARELAFLDAQGGRPQGFEGTAADRNARLFVPSPVLVDPCGEHAEIVGQRAGGELRDACTQDGDDLARGGILELAEGSADPLEAERPPLAPCFGQPVGVEEDALGSAGSQPPLDVLGVLAEPQRGSLAGRHQLPAVVHPQGGRMAGVRPAQALLVRVIGHARGGDELGAGTGALDQGGVRPAQQPARVVGEGSGGGERRPHERRAAPGLHSVADHVAHDQQRGVLRPFGDQVEVAADLIGGGHERRGQLQAGPPGQLGRGESVPDRSQIRQLVLGGLELLAQRTELLVAQLGLPAKLRDQRLLALLARVQIAAHARPYVSFGARPPQLCVLLVELVAHRSRFQGANPLA